MSEQWQTQQEAEKTTILEGLSAKVEASEKKTSELREDVFLGAFSVGITGAAAVALERVNQHWGWESDGFATLSALFVVVSYIKYRQYQAVKDRTFNIWRQKIELELED